MIDAASDPATLEEYLRFEEQSPSAHEFRRGYILALAEASGPHEDIKNNLIEAFAGVVKRNGCKLVSGGVKLICPNAERAIPDFGVTCDERDIVSLRRPAGEATIEHPWLLLEIISASTAAADRGEKLDDYTLVRELTHYILIDSRKQWMLVHERTPDGLLTIKGPLERYVIPGLGELTPEMVYDGTSVPRIA